MKFRFDKPTCQNIRKSLRKEWIETNGLGDYASSSLICCNTRKYHGLLVADLESPAGRHVLLSSLEESLLVGGRELCFSCRKHPGVYYPRGNEHLEEMDAGEWPVFRYRFGEVTLTRELMLIPGHRLLLVRYEVRGTAPDTPPVVLRVKPLLAFRNAHDLTRANPALRPETLSAPSGIGLRPYEALPRPCLCRWRAASSSTPLPTGASMWSIWWSGSAALPIRKICFSRAGSRSGLFPANLCSSPLRRRRSRRSTGTTSSAGSGGGKPNAAWGWRPPRRVWRATLPGKGSAFLSGGPMEALA